VKTYPQLTGKMTDLLIGDLFTDEVDVVWPPMESLYPEGKKPIEPWFAQTNPVAAANKANELFLPEGVKP
jgi:hypothetical protein